MLSTTKQAILAILSADPTIDADMAKEALKAAENATKGQVPAVALDDIMTRQEVADRLRVTTARVDQIARGGALVRVIPAGSSRSLGFTRTSVATLLNGRTA